MLFHAPSPAGLVGQVDICLVWESMPAELRMDWCSFTTSDETQAWVRSVLAAKGSRFDAIPATNHQSARKGRLFGVT